MQTEDPDGVVQNAVPFDGFVDGHVSHFQTKPPPSHTHWSTDPPSGTPASTATLRPPSYAHHFPSIATGQETVSLLLIGSCSGHPATPVAVDVPVPVEVVVAPVEVEVVVVLVEVEVVVVAGPVEVEVVVAPVEVEVEVVVAPVEVEVEVVVAPVEVEVEVVVAPVEVVVVPVLADADASLVLPDAALTLADDDAPPTPFEDAPPVPPDVACVLDVLVEVVCVVAAPPAPPMGTPPP